jgi:ribosome recycling factor
MTQISLAQADSSFQKAIDFFNQELSKIRSGRANPDLISGILVDAYSQKMPLSQLANINVADAGLLTVQPWDKSLVDNIVKAIEASDIGIAPLVDGDLIRLPLPALTQERREEYVKLLSKKTEEARISIRQIRKEVILWLEAEKAAGNLTEDDMKRDERELQQKVDAQNEKIDQLSKDKENELMQV